MNIGNFYKIVINVNNTILTFRGKIISADENFTTFIDKFGTDYTYNNNNIISFEKIEDYNND
jgi:hypothetical protein